MPPKMVKCAKCASVVPEKNFCARCGGSLVDTVNKQDALGEMLDSLNFMILSESMREQFERVNLARLQFLRMPNNGTIPRIKELRVTTEAQVFFAPSMYSELTALSFGVHAAADLFSDTRWATDVQGPYQENYCLFVHVDTQPFIATFHLPDWQHLEKLKSTSGSDGEVIRQHYKQTLEQLNIRSADFFFGGAQVQLKMRVAKPVKLLDTLATYMTDVLDPSRQAKHQPDTLQNDAPGGGGIRGFMRRVGQRVHEFLVGKDAEESASQLTNRPFHLAHFYDRIRMEFTQAVQQAVRSLQATDLLENKDETRRIVREDIRRFMGATLEAYGIELLEVPAFEFLCPELFTQQRAQGEIELRKKWLADQKERLRINREATALAKEEERFDKLLQFEDDKVELARTGELEDLADTNLAAAEARRRDRDVLQQEHARAQGALNAAAALQIEKNRALTANELEYDKLLKLAEVNAAYLAQNQKDRDTEFARMLEMVKVLPALPPAMQQAMLVAIRPELAGMFQGQAQAAGLEQQIAMLQEHNKANSVAHTEGVAQATALLQQIVQTAGHVLAGGQRVTLSPPPPSSLPGDSAT